MIGLSSVTEYVIAEKYIIGYNIERIEQKTESSIYSAFPPKKYIFAH